MDETTKDYLQDKLNQYGHLKDFKKELENFRCYSFVENTILSIVVYDEHGNSKKSLTQKRSMPFYYGDCSKEFFNKLKKAVNDIIIEEIEEAEKKMQEL